MKNSLKKAVRLIVDSDYRFRVLRRFNFYRFMPDREYLKRFFHAELQEELDLNAPKTFNQKLQWLKLHDRKPEYHQMVDKLEAKQYVGERIGFDHIIPSLGIWDRFEDIDFDSLPERFVLKCTHGSGDLYICTDKSELDIRKLRRKFNKFLKRKFYYYGREWPYKGLKPRIMAEAYMCDDDDDTENLTDYKIFCFDGVPRFVMTVRDRSKGKGKALHRWYDMDWNLQDLDLDYRDEIKTPEQRPTQMDEMLEIAAKLSAGIKHLRVDLYLVEGQIYFGELTLYHMSGCERFEPVEWDWILGSYLNLDPERNETPVADR